MPSFLNLSAYLFWYTQCAHGDRGKKHVADLVQWQVWLIRILEKIAGRETIWECRVIYWFQAERLGQEKEMA